MEGRAGRVRVFCDAGGEWRWQLKGGNGEIVATGEGHSRSTDAVRAWHTVAAMLAGQTDDELPAVEVEVEV